MKTAIILGIALALAGAGCDQKNDNASPENTKRNERDQSGNTVTPMDQGGSEADRATTQEIRQSVVKDDSLSMTAKNVKIITIDGVVTLRGPVKSDQEKTLIASLAQRASNVKRVDNQLEIATN
jgi:osmotically-inducible protein OsmY